MNINKQMRALNLAAVAALGLVLAGCSGGGADTVDNPVPEPPGSGSDYTGPVPATADIQAFRVEFWQKALATAGCQGCHNAGGQSPSFLRTDDVNQAYQQANGVVNRDNPGLSTIVTKVGGGHNCWLPDPGACATIMTRWITAWVGATDTGGKQIQLTEPEPVDPGGSKRLPLPGPGVSADAFIPPAAYAGVYQILDQHCSGCHQPDSATAQSPFFAAGTAPPTVPSAVYTEAYLAAIPKINLNDPAKSRFVVRVGREKHQCWTSDCAADAKRLEDAITALAGDPAIITLDTPDGTLSKAIKLFEGTVASGGNRYENSMIALYEFKTMTGSVAFDTSGVAPSADLNLSGTDVTWVGGWGINIRNGKAQASTTASRKFHQLITATGEYSIEAWVVPGNVTQEDARIISYSGSTGARNFTMGQQLYNYEFAARSSETDGDGGPRLSTDDDAEVLQASLQHVVMTFDPVNGRRIYVNGALTDAVDGSGGGTLDSWDNSFAFVLGNEVSNNRQWQGVFRLVAVHNRALTLPQIKQNFEAGVGQKFFLLFGVSHLIDVPRAYIMFEAAEYDSASYLFTNPKFISLDSAAMPGSIPLKGMRIGVNGAEAQVGQAYRLLDMNISNDQYSAATGQLLSSVGTIVPVDQGPDFDQFFLCFDTLGTRTDACSTYAAGVEPAPVLAKASSDIGVKLFDAINATMASITGVSPNNADVKRSYGNVRQSLPAVHDIQGYLSSHQTAVAQLALTYCNVMVNDPTLRSAFFPGTVNFSGQLLDPSDTDNGLNASGDALVNTLRTKMIGTANTQPDQDEFEDAVGGLIENLCTSGTTACGAGNRTTDVIKAACGAALGSAATLVQ